MLKPSQVKASMAGPDLQDLFSPRSIAHVGASPSLNAGRFAFIEYLNHMGFPGRLYPVNPKYPEIFGHRCYPSLAEIPDEVDLAILAVPAEACPKVLQDVPPGKLKFVVVHTSGFSEIDKNHLEQELLSLARAKNFRIIGPNCMGVFSEQGRICFWDDQKEFIGRPGTIGLVSQSGGLTIQIVTGCLDLGLNMNKAVSLGNQIDLSIHELVEFYGGDDSIETIVAYVESLRDGRRFLEVVRELAPRKPVLVWKGGHNEVAQAAARTHTGSMAGDVQIFESALRQAGAIPVDNYEMMMSLLRLLNPPRRLPGSRLAIICPGGGNTVSVSDAFGTMPHLTLPRLSEETREWLQQMLPEENVDFKNPVDPGSVGFTMFDKILLAVGQDPNIDSILMVLFDDMPMHFEKEEVRKMIVKGLSSMIAGKSREIGKPIYVHLLRGRDNNGETSRCRKLMADRFIAKKVPWTDGSFMDAARVVDRLAEYGQKVKLFSGA